MIGTVVHGQEHIHRVGVLVQQGVGRKTEGFRLTVIIHCSCPSCLPVLAGLHYTGLALRIHLQDMAGCSSSISNRIVGQQGIFLYEPHLHLVEAIGVRKNREHLLRLLQVGFGGTFIVGYIIVTLVHDFMHPQEILQLFNPFLENGDALFNNRSLLHHGFAYLRILRALPLLGVGALG